MGSPVVQYVTSRSNNKVVEILVLCNHQGFQDQAYVYKKTNESKQVVKII